MSYTGPDYNAIQTPTQWAELQLATMGLPVTASNINFLVSWAAMEGGNWHNTARFNPLNTTLGYDGSTVMSGGNTAGVQAYSSWIDGIRATAETLANYGEIMNALRSGDAMAANNSGQLGQDFSRWSGGGYTQIGGNSAYGNTTATPNATGGGTVTQAGATGTPVGANGQALSMSDIPQVVAYIRQNYGSDAWLLDIPEVSTVLEQAVVNGWDTSRIQAAIEQTTWWKTTSQAVKNYEQNVANNPAEYSFTTPGSQASQMLAQIRASAGQAGVQIDDQTAQTLATDALKYGWSSQQIQQAIGSRVTYNGQGGNAGTVVNQLKALAAQYFMNPSPQVLQSWAQNVAGGLQTTQQFQALMQQQAATKWTGYASQLQQGYTMSQLTDSLRSEAAKTLEVDPNSIDFLNNPVYSKILDYVPPDSPNGVHRVMTLSEMDQYLKSQPSWGYTQNARDAAAQLESTIATTWGKIAS